jgi:hypothetical protein
VSRFALAILLPLTPLFGAELFRDDFSKFPPGWLSNPIGQLNGAIQEYHYLEHRGVPTYPWRNPIAHLDSWVAPLFVTGDEEHPGGMAVLMSNGEEGTKKMKTFRPKCTYRDVTGHWPLPVTTDENGEAEFKCPAGKVSVWCMV